MGILGVFQKGILEKKFFEPFLRNRPIVEIFSRISKKKINDFQRKFTQILQSLAHSG
jgi:hypothetical protein